MGTRSLITFIEDGEPLVTVYAQFDGYPESRGKELALFLAGITMINGISTGCDFGTHANGMGCLAAQWIKQEKESLGSIYIYPPTLDPGEDSWERYLYTVKLAPNGTLFMTAWSLPLTAEPLCAGTPSDYGVWLEGWLKEREEE